jgi:DedD protein
MTPPDDDRPDGPEHDLYDETPRSILAATWFRALLVLIVLAVVGAVAVPYILDAMNPPAKSVASRPTPTPAPPAVTPTPPSTTSPPMSPSSTAMSATTDKAPDKPALPDKGPADKSATAMPATRRPAGVDKTPIDKPAMSEKPAPSDKSSAGAKPAPTEKPATAEKKDTRMAAAPEAKTKAAPTTKKRAATSSASTASAPRGAATGEWWVQVGAFRDESTAKKVAAKLREQNYKVEESVRGSGASAAKSAAADKPAPAASAPGPAGPDQYDVFVSGLSAAELSERLAAKGLAAEPAGSGAVIKPSLPLRDAVALSKDLAVDGFKVQVRRAGGAAPAPRATQARPEPAARGGDTLYRVRVGAFPDRATALTTLKELETKGYKPFIARGGP